MLSQVEPEDRLPDILSLYVQLSDRMATVINKASLETQSTQQQL